MTEFGLIKNGLVVNRIVADLEFVEAYALANGLEYSDDPNAQVDWTHTDGKFQRPAEPEAKREPSAKAIYEALLANGTLKEGDVQTVQVKG